MPSSGTITRAATIPVPAIRLDEVRPHGSPADWDRPISLTVPDGSCFVLQTTASRSALLFRLCAGLAPLGGGRLEVLGCEPALLDRREAQRFRRALGVGFVPHGLLSNLTLRMNVIMPLVYGGVAPPDEAARAADESLAACGLTRLADRRPADVGPDDRQRAVIARAVARSPELLLLENPVWAVDTSAADSLLTLCRERARTVVIAIHRHDATVARFADGSASWDDDGIRAVAA